MKIPASIRSKAIGMIAGYVILALVSVSLLQEEGTSYLDSAILKATASYALARGLNGVVTVLKESSISAGFVVEGTIAVGQILDPVNDLVERFSWVMLLSIVSLGIQKILMLLGVKVGIGIFIFSLLLLGMTHWTPNSRRTAYRFLLLAIIVQVAIPFTTTVGSVVSEAYIQHQYVQAEQAITEIKEELQAVIGEGNGPEPQEKWYERLDPQKILQRVKVRAAEVIDHLVNLIILFIFETIVLPLATLWGLFQVFKLLIMRTS